MRRTRIHTLRGLLWLVSRLPFPLLQSFGAFVGRCLWLARGELRHTTEVGVGVAFPEKSSEERQTLARQSLIETGKTAVEVSYIWERPVPRCLELIREIEGQALVDEACASQRGLVLLAPHLGNWELAGLYFSSRFSMAALYSPPRLPEMEDYMSRVRGRVGSELVRADRRGVMRLFSILREGGVVGILPDQNPDASGGIHAPFFGMDVLTMKLVSRMIQKTGARALVTYAERLPAGKGFRLVVDEVDPRLYDEDILTSVTRLNATVENVVRRIPAQYQWEYKRFKKRPAGEPNPYNPDRLC